MLIIGGCELPLEKNPYNSVEILDSNQHTIMKEQMLIPVRGSMAHFYNSKLYLFGGCKGPKDHISDVQIYDIISKQWHLAPYKLIKERSCFMMTSVDQSQLYILGGFDGYECL